MLSVSDHPARAFVSPAWLARGTRSGSVVEASTCRHVMTRAIWERLSMGCNRRTCTGKTLPSVAASISERRCNGFRCLSPTGELADHRAAKLPQMPRAFLGEGVQHVATPSAVYHPVNHRQPGHAIALPHPASSAGRAGVTCGSVENPPFFAETYRIPPIRRPNPAEPSVRRLFTHSFRYHEAVKDGAHQTEERCAPQVSVKSRYMSCHDV